MLVLKLSSSIEKQEEGFSDVKHLYINDDIAENVASATGVGGIALYILYVVVNKVLTIKKTILL